MRIPDIRPRAAGDVIPLRASHGALCWANFSAPRDFHGWAYRISLGWRTRS